MNCREIDQEAIRIPQRSGLLPCLYVPIAAKDEYAIQKYVGEITEILADGTPNKALLVESYDPPERDTRLPIWQQENAAILHHPRQVWVHVDYHAYRKTYNKAFQEDSLKGLVLDHILNRRVARLKGFIYLRIVPISRAANSSSGGLSEKWSVEYHSTPAMMQRNKESKAAVQYADLADIVKMMNIKTGGGIMDPVNEAQALVDLPIAHKLG
jgi:hypothetical protein